MRDLVLGAPKMIELHPEIITKNGVPESVVLPYKEFLQIEVALQRLSETIDTPDPRYGGFWDNLTAEELAKRQGVKPVESIKDLYWDGDPSDWDGFEEAVAQSRSEHPLH
jgi:hypothetical protein